MDAATCTLPDNTWFFKGVAHVNFWYDSQATKFLAGLITNPEKKQSVQTVKAATGNGQFVNTDEKQNIVPFSTGKSTNSSGTKNTNSKNTATATVKSPATGAIGAWQWAAPVWPPPACSLPCTLCLPKRRTTQLQNNICT